MATVGTITHLTPEPWLRPSYYRRHRGDRFPAPARPSPHHPDPGRCRHGRRSGSGAHRALNLGVLQSIVVSRSSPCPPGAIPAIAIFYVLQACFS